MSIEKTAAGTYKVRYRDENNTQTSATFKRKRDAEEFERNVRIEIKNGTWLSPKLTQVEVSKVWSDFLELKQGKKKDYESIWKLHIEPRWGSTMVGRVESLEFDKWLISKKLSPQRIGKIHLLMSMLLDHAIQMKSIKANPLKDLLGKRKKNNLPKADSTLATKFFSLPELMNVAREADYYEDVVLLLGLCGLRWGELVGLTVKDLNVRAGTILIRRALVEVDGRLIESTTKANRWREVKLPQILRDKCLNWAKNKSPDDPLFHTEAGTLLRNTNFTRRVFTPAMERAQVNKIRIHDLRHTAATIAISSGATPNMVKEMLGHSDVQLTMRVYAHIFESDREKVATNIDRAVYEVHKMCTADIDGVIAQPFEALNRAQKSGIEGLSDAISELRTWDYEFGALTN
jgi:integrase